MAKEVGVNVFRTYTHLYGNTVVINEGNPEGTVMPEGMRTLSKAVQDWYQSDCANPHLENVFLTFAPLQSSLPKVARRPKYEDLQTGEVVEEQLAASSSTGR